MTHPLVERLRRIARTFEDCTAEERRYIANLAEEIDRLLGGNAEPDTRNAEREWIPSTVTHMASAMRELGSTLHGLFH